MIPYKTSNIFSHHKNCCVCDRTKLILYTFKEHGELLEFNIPFSFVGFTFSSLCVVVCRLDCAGCCGYATAQCVVNGARSLKKFNHNIK